MSLWTTMADPAALQGLQVPKAVRFSKKDLAAAQAILEKRLKPYRTKVTARDLAQPVP